MSEGEKVSRLAAFERTRKIGYASFIIPLSVIATMMYFATDNVHSALYPIQRSAIEKTGIYFAIWVNVEVGLNLGKYYLCRRGFGMTQDHYKLIIGRRDRWSML